MFIVGEGGLIIAGVISIFSVGRDFNTLNSANSSKKMFLKKLKNLPVWFVYGSSPLWDMSPYNSYVDPAVLVLWKSGENIILVDFL